ncbi:tryptophan synthase subunit alpha [Micromonospora robiginosa]|uniref:tryptophan synthase n=1 Tax=Micromonospora robiginosa TaxID=2749844 RepID=A0A7L6B4B5_9ACTN|nr:tryptophan synthase subunit alpha [Micromonospora ferruginea]QLQ36635.1 tryptophan synthase subunit alpha [Micromonospora ferruginea]
MADFFAGRRGAAPGLAVFLTAGDPPVDRLAELVELLDERGVDCLELAVPFPDSVTDGPVLRRAARRALDRGTDADEVLAFVAQVRPRLRRTRIALLADWRHTVRPVGERAFVRRVADAGADGLLVHALPPRLRAAHLAHAADAGLPVVTTCYATSSASVRAAAARDAGAYVYLVATHGRSGTAPERGYGALRAAVDGLRAAGSAPIAVGFGVRDAADVRQIGAAGADAAVVGTAAALAVERTERTGQDLLAGFDTFLRSMAIVSRPAQKGTDR